MNKITRKWLYLSILITGMTLAATSCEKDEKTPDRDKFLGTYTMAQDCSGQTNSYEIIIEASATSEDAVVINNFFSNANNDLTATVSGDNITIPSQVVNSITFSGNGSIAGNILTLSYTLANGAASISCTGIATKN